ncbi:unnamed protein product [Sphagnum troendelagicum]|uniref:Ubiquitin-like domain-containing protein n=1 Tax=Sphagnum troendelagicum TaxID=128251 RepID=A0ABP0URT2_9BRYO
MEPIQERSGGSGGEVPGETMEIKIKTLDSQSYTIRVAKNVAVPALKEHLATVVGVPADSQRLICRGKVLKDDQLLSAYNVEDGHTLHLVARPLLPPAGTGPSTAGAEGLDSSLAHMAGHVSHSLLMGTINIPDTGEGAMPDLSRIISAVLNTVGIANVGAQNTGGNGNTPTVTMGVLPTQGGETGGTQAEGRPALGEEDSQVRALELQIDALYGVPPNNSAPGVPSPFQAVQHPGVVPDVLTTMSQYLDRLEQSFSSHGRAVSGTSVGSSTPSGVDTERTRSSPAALGALVQRVNNLLRGQASSALAHLGEQLANEAEITNAAAREEVQHTAIHDGNLIQQVGALLLELGRTTLSLRMGQSPGEAVVNAGPAIFISPAGPNPIMVQPLPLQTSAAFPIGQSQPHPLTLAPSSAAAGTPRSVHIHIHTSDLGAPSASPSPSLSSPPPQRSAQELALAASRASGGVTVHQMPERADLSSPSQTLTDTGITIHPVNESPGGTTATPIPPAHTGMQGSIMTFDEHGAMRVVPVHSHAGSSSGHPWASFETGAHFHPLLARFQHQFSGQPFTLSRNAVPPVSQPASTPHVAASRQPSLTTDTQQGASGAAGTGDRGNSMSGSGGVDVARLVTSVAPLLHHLAEALQNGPPPLGAQSTQPQRSSMETDVRGAEDPQASIGSAEGLGRQSIGEGGVVSMELMASSEDGQIMATNSQPTSGETMEVGESGDTSGPSLVSPPVGLGLGGLQPLLPRTRRRRQQSQHSEEQQRQAGQSLLRNLAGYQEAPGDTPSRNRRAPGLGNILRAAGVGSETQQAGPGILGQFMRSPAMETLVQQVMQGVGDVEAASGGRGAAPAAGQDLGGMLQHMMPMMSQVLGGGALSMMPPPAVATSSQSQAEGGSARDTSGSERWKQALTPVTQRLEEGEAAQEVLRSVADAAGTRVLGNSSVTTSTSLAQHVSQADGLADAYLAVLFHDLAARVAADPDFEDGSRFPSATRVFQQHSDAPTEADGH